jgi:hypothetical protein
MLFLKGWHFPSKNARLLKFINWFKTLFLQEPLLYHIFGGNLQFERINSVALNSDKRFYQSLIFVGNGGLSKAILG